MIICPECRTLLGGLSVEQCPNCDWRKEMVDNVHVYLAAKDRSEAVLQAYAGNYEQLAQVNVVKSNLDKRYIGNQAKNIADKIRKLEGLEVCDLGCGQGMLTRELLARGASHVTAVDISPTYLRRIAQHPGVLAVLANAERLPFSRAFDVIFCTDVMEHVLNLGSFLISLNWALRFGGKACIRVPYRESLLLYSPWTKYEYEFGHLRSFNEDLVKIYMKAAGFEVRRFSLDGFGLGMPKTFITQNKWLHKGYSWLRDRIERRLEDPTIVTRWPAFVAGIAMRPNEIVFVAEKVKEIAVSERRGYELVSEERTQQRNWAGVGSRA